MTPDQIACRHVEADGTNCGAEAGYPCVWRMPHGGNVMCKHFGYHAERIEDAGAMSSVPDPVSPDDFDKAVEESGLL